MPPLNILYVGPLGRGQTCLQRFNVLGELGHRLTPVNSQTPDVGPLATLSRKIRFRLLGPADWACANDQILAAADAHPFDVLWLDKGNTITAATLLRFRARQPTCAIVGFTLDDMVARRDCGTRAFREHLPLYDIFFTNKSYNVPELLAMGARRVEFFDNGYDRNTHRPTAVTSEDRVRLGGPVGFIGDYEDARARSIVALADAGIPVRVWGVHWEHLKRRPACLTVENRFLFDADYAKAICAFDINLAFLRKTARDLQTTRSVEIPACGGFMLAERTSEHCRLFEEGTEAEFFDSEQELLGKVRYYLEHPEDRLRIASAGRDRCVRAKYSNHDRLSSMLARVHDLLIRSLRNP